MTTALKIRFVDNLSRLATVADRARRRYLYRAAAYVRTTARRSIRRRKSPSAPNSPPSTRTGRLKKAIRFYVDQARGLALVGPSVDVVGPAGAEHEHGGQWRDEHFAPRPYMGPAYELTRPKLPDFYRQSF